MNFSTIRIEGGLLPAELLEQVALGEARGQRPEDFGLEKARRLTDEIAAAWADARAYWDSLQRALRRVPEGDPATTQTREQWVVPLLRSLGYAQVTPMRSAAVVEGQTFFVSHRAGETDEAPPVHIVGAGAKLDERPPSGRPRLSPHALLQEYLNRTEHVWGIVTNGAKLRLLRDSSRMTRPSYVEFDLEAMLAGEKFAEFGVFYRLLHRTRLPETAQDAAHCLLETYYHEGIEQGGRVREKLREGVDEALKRLGNGFLAHPANAPLRERLRSGALPADEYYRQLLRLVYRLLFLLVAEERGLIVTGAANGSGCHYTRHYSISRLRGLAEQSLAGTQRHSDLWLGLLATFRLFEEDGAGAALSVPALDGDLFGPLATPDLNHTHLPNSVLLAAMRHLSLYEERGIRRRVNYAALDVEELGSVYESLLDYRPVTTHDLPLTFDLVTGSERKTTGSYYTRPELVQELIESALEPVMEERLKSAGAAGEKERALISIKVCDPACGSGHFLLAASRRIGRELARVRSGEAEPTPTDFRRGVRDAIRHCIYGVDMNPLAVDLCKVALWMEAHVAGEPLTFLDHRIRLGNSLIGGFPVQVSDRSERTRDLPPNIPDEAFDAVAGDDKKVAAAVKRRNRDERMGQTAMLLTGGELQVQQAFTARRWDEYSRMLRELGEMPDATVAGVRAKQDLMEDLRQTREYEARKFALDLWTAAFFWPLEDPNGWVPTDGVYRAWVEHGIPVLDAAREQVQCLAEENRFFHWSLEFPDVFNAPAGGTGGFDLVLGNPPWERIKLQEGEHWIDEPDIVAAPTKAERLRRIEEYRRSPDPIRRARIARFDAAKHAAEAWSKFVRQSGRWPLTAVGDVNTYALFAELAWNLLNHQGRTGIIVPTGIATDDTCKQFFAALNEQRALASLYDFENREALFVGVHRSYKFCLLTISERPSVRADFAFFLTRTEQLDDDRRRFPLAPEDLSLINPNTRTCPIFRTRADAELTTSIYSRIPILVDERGGRNPWGVWFLGMFHMSNDSGLFRSVPGAKLHPLYEAKMIWHYDHRWATYIGGDTRECSDQEKQDPRYGVNPRYWVPAEEVERRLEQRSRDGSLLWRWDCEWLLGFRDITNSTNERTVVSTLLSRIGVGNKIPLLLLPGTTATLATCLLANLDSLALDYAARQKVGGATLNFFIFKQFPVLPPDRYSPDDLSFIAPRVLELVYTSWDMQPFARDLGYDGPPFRWDEERRARLRAQLDAYYFKLYGLTRKQVRYVLDPYNLTDRELASILDPQIDEEHADKVSKTRDFPGETFRVLKQNEIRKYGEYRTQKLVLAYDQAIRAGNWSLLEMKGLPQLDLGPEPKVGKQPEPKQGTLDTDTRRTGTGG